MFVEVPTTGFSIAYDQPATVVELSVPTNEEYDAIL